MKIIIFAVSLLISFQVLAESSKVQLSDGISIGQAQTFVGQQKTVCGEVVQTVTRKGYTYVNFGDRYPNQTFHLFITNPKRYNNLGSLTNRTVCASGKIELYKNKPEITNPQSITIKD